MTADALVAPNSLGWFARHEVRLAWRDALMMLRGGRRRNIGAAIALIVFLVVLHAIAYAVLAPSVAMLRHPDKAFLLAVTGSAFLTWTLLLSQAMETVTRSFYARADLDLILSSPAPAQRLFAIRIAANALSTVAMAALLVGPAINVAAVLAGPRFLLAYGVLAAMGTSALAVAVGITVLLFRLVGPKRTRLLAQVVAACVGAGFVVGIQAAAIVSYGSLSRTAMFQSPQWVAASPGLSSPFWWPARAALGDVFALGVLLCSALILLVAAAAGSAAAFSRHAATVSSLPTKQASRRDGPVTIRPRAPGRALRAKEWTLLCRDPWLVSQSLMQVLYLLPPALLLWRDFGKPSESLVILVPILVMAAGQLAGGLAWLAISGEDAPDLIATAPVSPGAVVRAKVEAVLVAVALPVVPIALAMAFVSPFLAGVTIIGAGLTASAATAVQLDFKSQASRSNFRRRQTSSRMATFAEAFVSIAMASTAGLVAAGFWAFALVPAAIALVVLATSRAVARPSR